MHQLKGQLRRPPSQWSSVLLYIIIVHVPCSLRPWQGPGLILCDPISVQRQRQVALANHSKSAASLLFSGHPFERRNHYITVITRVYSWNTYPARASPYFRVWEYVRTCTVVALLTPQWLSKLNLIGQNAFHIFSKVNFIRWDHVTILETGPRKLKYSKHADCKP